jgi:hypothetical protein
VRHRNRPDRSDVIQRLALLNAWFDDEPRPLPEGPADEPA